MGLNENPECKEKFRNMEKEISFLRESMDRLVEDRKILAETNATMKFLAQTQAIANETMQGIANGLNQVNKNIIEDRSLLQNHERRIIRVEDDVKEQNDDSQIKVVPLIKKGILFLLGAFSMYAVSQLMNYLK